MNFAKFLRTSFLIEHLRWLLLMVITVVFFSVAFAAEILDGKSPTLSGKCPYSEFFWFVFSRISPNTGKYGPEKLLIRTLFTQCKRSSLPSLSTSESSYLLLGRWSSDIFSNDLNGKRKLSYRTTLLAASVFGT